MPSSKPTVGIIPTLAELYRKSNPALPSRYLEHWRPVIGELLQDKAVVHWAGLACTRDEFAAGVSHCEKAGCSLLVVLPLAYASSGAALEPLLATRLPLLLISSARDATIPTGATGDDLRANQAVHGVQDLANILRRHGRDFHVIAGHPEQPAFRRKLALAVQAAVLAAILKKARVGRIGTPMSGMLDLSFDPEAQNRLLGFSVESIAIEELADAASQVSATLVGEIAAWIRSSMQVAADIAVEEVEAAARACAGLEKLVELRDLQAVAINILELVTSGVPALPYVGAGRLMSRGIGYAGEGDVLTAALGSALASATGQATFTEMFCADFRRGEILLSHMGEANLAMADPGRPIHLRAKPNEWGGRIRALAPVFQFKAGPVTLFSLSQTSRSSPAGAELPAPSFQLAAIGGEIVVGPEHPRLSNPYSYFRPRTELAALLEAYARNGGTHHLAMTSGDYRSLGPVLADYCGLTYREIPL